jgi:hypothetical protein
MASESMQTVTRTLTLSLAAAALLSGCGSGSHPAASNPATRAQAARKAVNPADAISANMVSAVAVNKTASVPVEVRFELKNHPQVAQPVDVDLVIVPLSGAVDRVSGKVETEDGLDLVDGAQIPASERPAEGVPIRHTIRIQPKQDGIFTFSAVVTVDAGGGSSSQTFSIPVIAGAGMPDLPAHPTPTPAASTAAAAPARTSPALAATPRGGAAATQ